MPSVETDLVIRSAESSCKMSEIGIIKLLYKNVDKILPSQCVLEWAVGFCISFTHHCNNEFPTSACNNIE
jgi:hypothetical protein